jgi:hypothetical protein
MIIKEVFNYSYSLEKSDNEISILLKNKISGHGAEDIDIFLVNEIKKTNVYLVSYILDGAIETHIVNENLLMGGTNRKNDLFKKSEFSRLVASAINISIKKYEKHKLPIRFWTDDERKTKIYKKAISKFDDAIIEEVDNYETINGDTRTVYIIRKKENT